MGKPKSDPHDIFDCLECDQALLSAIKIFADCQKMVSCDPDLEQQTDSVLGLLEKLDKNFRDSELSECFSLGAISLTLLRSVAYHCRQKASQIPNESPELIGVSSGRRNTEPAEGSSSWLAFCKRAESLLSGVKRWNTRPLLRSSLQHEFCPLCSQAIRKAAGIGGSSQKRGSRGSIVSSRNRVHDKQVTPSSPNQASEEEDMLAWPPPDWDVWNRRMREFFTPRFAVD